MLSLLQPGNNVDSRCRYIVQPAFKLNDGRRGSSLFAFAAPSISLESSCSLINAGCNANGRVLHYGNASQSASVLKIGVNLEARRECAGFVPTLPALRCRSSADQYSTAFFSLAVYPLFTNGDSLNI